MWHFYDSANIDFYIDDTIKVCKEIDSLLDKIR